MPEYESEPASLSGQRQAVAKGCFQEPCVPACSLRRGATRRSDVTKRVLVVTPKPAMTLPSRLCVVLVAFVPAWVVAQSNYYQCSPGVVYTLGPCAPNWNTRPAMTPVPPTPIAKIERGMTASDVVRIMGLPDKVLLDGPAARPRQKWIYPGNDDSVPFVMFSRGVVERAGLSFIYHTPGLSIGHTD